MSAIGLVATLVLASAPHLVFMTGSGEWAQITEEGKEVRRFRDFAGLPAIDVAVSPDGARYAVASTLPNGKRALLLSEAFEAKPRIIEGPGPVLEHVAFSQDGEWVYFSANDPRGPRFNGQPMPFAQVYRVQFSGEAIMRRLSSAAGCHMMPSEVGGGVIAFAHAACVIPGRSLDLLDSRTGKEREVMSIEDRIIEVSGHPAKRLAFLKAHLDGAELFWTDLRTLKPRSLGVFPSAAMRRRLQWSLDGRRIYLMIENAVRVVELDGSSTSLLELK
jgi:hypothetical protein